MLKKKLSKIFLIVNASVSFTLLAIVLWSLGSRSNFKTLQVEQLRIISKNSSEEINLGFSNSHATISIINEKGEIALKMSGGSEPGFALFENSKPIAFISTVKDKGAEFALSDSKAVPKVHISSSDVPGVFLKNQQNKTVGSFTVVNDGGGGFGLADSKGAAAALIRGGSTPSIAFFSGNDKPLAAFGIIQQQTPHMLISGPVGEEGILIHGGRPNSMLVVDENGKVKILISKHGVFQGKDENDMEFRKKDKKIFSLDDGNRLFPSTYKTKR